MSERNGHFNAALGGSNDDTTYNQGLRRQLHLALLDVNGVSQVELKNYHVRVVFHGDIVTAAEIDAIVIDLVTKAATGSTLFKDVDKDGKIRRHEAAGKLNLDKRAFEVVMTNLATRPAKPTKAVLGKSKRVFDLNGLIVGLSPEDGSKQDKVTTEFHSLFGAKVAKIEGVYDFATWNAQVQVTYYGDMIKVDDLDTAVKKVLQEIYDDENYANLFPHLRGEGKSLEIAKAWTAVAD